MAIQPPAPATEPVASADRPQRTDLFTAERQARFLAALAEAGSVRGACARVGVSAECVYRLRRRCAVFGAAWDGALVLARQVAEDVLAVRALDGVEEPVFYRGEQVGSRWRFDARLLLAHLARLDAHAAQSLHGARRAERFDELLALVAGAEPPEALAAPAAFAMAGPAVTPGRAARTVDPVLPPERAAHVDCCIADLDPGADDDALDDCIDKAEREWTGWQDQARALVDRQVLAAAIAPGADPAAWTLSTVSTGALSAGLMAGERAWSG